MSDFQILFTSGKSVYTDDPRWGDSNEARPFLVKMGARDDSFVSIGHVTFRTAAFAALIDHDPDAEA